MFPGLPSRWLRLDEVREAVLHRRCPQQVRDRVWAHLVVRSRAEGGAWAVACAGVALPALTTIAARLSARFAADPGDLHSAVLAGFLSGLAEIDLDAPRIMNRLRWAAFRAGHAALRDALDAPAPATGRPVLTARLARSVEVQAGHPDLVLARAVADGALAPGEADLIAATRLDGRPLTELAAERGHSYPALKQQRRRAEHRLATYLHQSREPAGPGIARTAEKSRTVTPDVSGSSPRTPRPQPPRGPASGAQG
nr:hypothetical protein [Saccharopolyspora gloriosae]